MMTNLDQAYATQLANIEKRTGKTRAQLAGVIARSGLTKHGELRDMLKNDLGMGHGDANALVHHVLKSDGASAVKDKGQSPADVLDEIYAGPKGALRPIHDALRQPLRRSAISRSLPRRAM